MADPATLAIIGGVQAGLQSVLKTAPGILAEVHDASTKRRLTKLCALFLKAQMGELTEKDFKQAKHYYAKIEAVALISRNPMMLNSLKEGLAHLQTSLVVKSLFDRNEKPEIKDTSDIEEEKVDSEIPPVFDDVSEVEGCVTIEEIGESPSGFADDDRVSLDSSSISPLEGPSSLATDTKLAKFKELERRAIWGLAAVMPQLLFVPKIRQKC